MNSSKVQGAGYIAACSMLWSTAGILIKLLPWNPMIIASLRSLIAGMVLWCVLCIQGTPKPVVNRSTLVTGLCLGTTTMLFVTVNKLTTAATAIVLQSANPIFVLLFYAIVRKQRFSRRDLTVVLIVLGGVALFFFEKLSFERMLGNVLGILSAISLAGAFISASESASLHETMSGVLFGHVFCMLLGLPALFVSPPPFTLYTTGVLLLLGIFQLGIPYVLFSLGARSCSPLAISLITMLEPVFNPLWVAIFIHEIPGPLAIAGGVVVIVTLACWCITNARSRQHTA